MAPKRKRAGTASSSKEHLPESSERPGSRAPPVEDSAAAAAAATTTNPGSNDGQSSEPVTKRTRNTRATSLSSKKAEDERVGRPRAASKVQMPANGAAVGTGENGEAGSMRMEAPPPAGAVDPAGYRTNAAPAGRPVRVYADGVFDMFHLGHMRVLQQAKTAFPDTYLIVGVTGDTETHRRKGLTVMSGQERAESLRHCRWVDEVIEDCPWIINMDFLRRNAIDFVAHDDLPYGASEGDDIYKPIKEQGMFLVTQRTEGVSTTGIITKIVRDYEKYVSRQLMRGTSRQELNLSWFRKNELDIKRHVSELRDTIRTNWTTTGQEISKEIKQFWQPSRPGSPAPSLRAGTPGRAAGAANGAKSPSALDRIGRSGRDSTPHRERGRNTDFAAGYAMGLIGGVKSWMEGSRRNNLSDSRAESPVGSDNDNDSVDPKSPVEEEQQQQQQQQPEEVTRGRAKEKKEGEPPRAGALAEEV